MSPELKATIIKRLFGAEGIKGLDSVDGKHANAFWRFYYRTCARESSDASVKTHETLLSLADALREGRTRAEVRAMLRSTVLNTGESINTRLMDSSLELAATLLTMMTVGNYTYGLEDKQSIRWPDDRTVADIVQARFSPKPVMHADVIFEKSFHALNLKRIGGLKIIWTWNLADHLRLSDDDHKLHIFHGLTCLHWQLASSVWLLNVYAPG